MARSAAPLAASLAVWSAWQADSLAAAVAAGRPVGGEGLIEELVRGGTPPAWTRAARVGERWLGTMMRPAAWVLEPTLLATLGALVPGGRFPGTAGAGCSALQELDNKLRVLARFRSPGLGQGSAGREEGLAELVRRAEGLDSWQALWAVEGLGFLHGRRLGDPAGEGVPEWCRIPLHAGLGLALAIEVLGQLCPGGGGAAVPRALDRFLALCRRHGSREHVPVAVETLGFAAHNLFPGGFYALEREVRVRGPELRHLFWHGAGRGLYFSLTQTLWPVLGLEGRVRTEAPDRSSRASALAGLAWALVLVNIRHPMVVERHVDRLAGRVWVEDALARGGRAGLAVWQATAGEDRTLQGFLAHEPSRPGTAAWWRRLGGAARGAPTSGDEGGP